MGSVDSTLSPWFATHSLNANEMRQNLAALVGGAPDSALAVEGGVFPSMTDPFYPTSNGTASAPRISVAPGQLAVQRPVGGPYVATLDTARNVSLDTPLPSSGQSRIDRLVAQILDSEADGSGTVPPTSFALRLVTLTGAGSSSPTPPNLGSGQLPLWRFTVSSGGVISALVSERAWTRAAGAPRLVEDGDTRPGSYPGDQRIYRSGQVDVWLLVDGTWQWRLLTPSPVDAAVPFSVNSAGYTAEDSGRPLRAYMDSRGAVRFAGFMRRTGANTNIAAGTQYLITSTPIPAALRPTGFRDMPMSASAGSWDLTVRADGHLLFKCDRAMTLVQNQTWWSFDSCTYQRA